MPRQVREGAVILVVDGIRFIRHPSSSKRNERNYFTGWSVKQKRPVSLHRYVWEKAHGPIPKGSHIHHKDLDSTNNALDNLECLTPKEHIGGIHYPLRDPQVFSDAHRQAFAEGRAKYAASTEGRADNSRRTKEQWESVEARSYECEVCKESFESKRTYGVRHCSAKCKAQARRNANIDLVARTCAHCGSEFMTNKYRKAVCCGPSCGSAYGKAQKRKALGYAEVFHA